MKISKFWVFVTSIIPGIGHLVLGMNNRGIQLFIIFLGSIYLTQFTDIFAFICIICVVYSVFDALQRHRKYLETGILEDDVIFNMNFLNNNRKVIGWIFIIFGILFMINKIIPMIFPYYYDFSIQIVFALILMGLGVYLLKGSSLPAFFEEVKPNQSDQLNESEIMDGKADIQIKDQAGAEKEIEVIDKQELNQEETEAGEEQ